MGPIDKRLSDKEFKEREERKGGSERWKLQKNKENKVTVCGPNGIRYHTLHYVTFGLGLHKKPNAKRIIPSQDDVHCV